MTRLRLGQCSLNHYLYQIGKHLDGLHEKSRVPENVQHALVVQVMMKKELNIFMTFQRLVLPLSRCLPFRIKEC